MSAQSVQDEVKNDFEMALQVNYYDTHIEDESESDVKKRSILRQQKKEEIK